MTTRALRTAADAVKDPRGAGLVVRVGATRFCGSFGGTIRKDDGAKFLAGKAPAPASCAVLLP